MTEPLKTRPKSSWEIRGEAAEARASVLEDAAFHFQTCRRCADDGEDTCESGRQFAAYLRGEMDLAASALGDRSPQIPQEPCGVQIDYTCCCSTPMFVGDEPRALRNCDVHRDGRPYRLRSFGAVSVSRASLRQSIEKLHVSPGPVTTREDLSYIDAYNGALRDVLALLGGDPAAAQEPSK